MALKSAPLHDLQQKTMWADKLNIDANIHVFFSV